MSLQEFVFFGLVFTFSLIFAISVYFDSKSLTQSIQAFMLFPTAIALVYGMIFFFVFLHSIIF